MIREYLLVEWRYLHLEGKAGDDGFDAWVNSLTNIELVQYIDNALARAAMGDE